jgi:hypothetical protein
MQPETVVRLLFILCHVVLLYVLFRGRYLWFTTLPVFSWYVAVSGFVAALPRNPESSLWVHSWWVPQQAILFLGLLSIVWEFISWVQPGLLRREFRFVRLALFGIATVAVSLCVLSESRIESSHWFPQVVLIRQIGQLGILIILFLFSLYVWCSSVRVMTGVALHGWLLFWLCFGQSLTRTLHPVSGLIPLTPAEYDPIPVFSYLSASACLLVWALVFTRTPPEALLNRLG